MIDTGSVVRLNQCLAAQINNADTECSELSVPFFLTAQMLHNIQCQSRHPTHAKFYLIFCYTISELEG